MKQIRCAIYTRKSSEEGLEQDFNSLDAQYVACSAYIASQASEGWTLIADRYDDGGISGGTLERPALKTMLANIASGRIEIVVVYKVDRLTRSLLDFSKLVEAFDKAGTSFVSVTQSFNTTTSMGRLTLNMLLSFAQFEREVTAERIRDKLAASKQRGMWMGGTPPVGYEPDGRSLAIVEEHAELVRLIFKLYLDLGNVRLLQEELHRRGLIKPVRTTRIGRRFGGTSFSRGELYAILSNPIYIGRIRHRNTTYDGRHRPIVDQETWDRVQTALSCNRTGERHVRAVANPSILAGKLFDGSGEKMIACHAGKGAKRYRYYVSANLHHVGNASRTDGMRIPAPEIEPLVSNKIAELFDDPIVLMETVASSSTVAVVLAASPTVAARAVSESGGIARMLRGSDAASMARLIGRIVQRIDVAPAVVTITLSGNQIADCLGLEDAGALIQPMTIDGRGYASSFQITVPTKLKRSGMAMRLILPSGQAASPRVDDNLVKAIATAYGWWEELLQNPKLRISDLARNHGLTKSWITRVLRLAFLDPAITEMILAGKAPAHLTQQVLRSEESIPLLWSAQRALHRINATI